jgi:hypothetical protein
VRTLTLEDAKQFLAQYNRWTLSDGTFGGSDVGWTDDNGKQVAHGWFEGNIAQVGIDISHPLSSEVAFEFKGDDAGELRYCGKSSRFEKNDPDEDTDLTMLWSDPGLLDEPAYHYRPRC